MGFLKDFFSKTDIGQTIIKRKKKNEGALMDAEIKSPRTVKKPAVPDAPSDDDLNYEEWVKKNLKAKQ